MFRDAGFEVINTHIAAGQDFFLEPVPQVDYIISNPPYSLKYEVLKRLFEIGIPFAMLVCVVGLFESKKRFEMFRANKFEILYFDKRINYLKDYTNSKVMTGTPFSSVYICSNILPQTINFEEYCRNEKKKK